MAVRNPAPLVNPRDPILGALKPFLDWVHRQLETEIPTMRRAVQSWDAPSLAVGASASVTVSVPGARLGDLVVVSHSQPLKAGAILTAWVGAADSVTVALTNSTGAVYDLTPGALRVLVMQVQS